METPDSPSPGETHRSILARLSAADPAAVLILGAPLLLMASETARAAQPELPGWFANLTSFGAVLLFLLGAGAARCKALPGWVGRPAAAAGRFFGVSTAQILYLVFGLLFALLAAASNGLGAYQDSASLTLALWLVSILFVFLGAWRKEGRFFPGRAWPAVGGLALAAFALRIVSVTSIPTALTGDEASMGVSARAFIDGTANNIFSVGWFSFPSLYYFIESLSIRLLGSTTLALRFPAALAGALTVGAVYLLGRALFGRLTGLLAAVFLAGLHFHIHFSRLGLNNVWDGLAIAVILGALWSGWQRGRRFDFILAGVLLGLAQYFYVSSRFLFVLVPAWVGVAALIDRQQVRRRLPDLLLMGLAAFVTVAPLAWYYLRLPDEFMAPITRVRLTPEWVAATALTRGVPEWRVLIDQVWIGLKGFTHEEIRAWYQPGTPILRPVPAALFLLGMALLALRPKDLRTWMVLLLFAAFGVSSGLSFDPPAAQRYVAAAPWAALVAAFAVSEAVDRLQALWPERRRLLAALAVAGIALAAADDARFYFLEYTPPTAQRTDNDAVAQRLADYLQTRPDITEVYFFGAPRMGFYSIQSIHFLAPEVTGVDMNHPWGAAQNPRVTAQDPVFVFLPDKQADLDAARAAYPGGRLVEERTGEGALIYWLYEVDPDD